jgi:methylenetetrahydrofolate dehydrogenase (NADP+)/methenyltetrahydrofolate cyclohydrolase
MGNLIDGKIIAEKIIQKTDEKVSDLKEKGIKPKLSVVLVGHDKPSHTYVSKKEKLAKKVGINFDLHKFDEINTEDLIKKILDIQKDPDLSGLIVQLPLPEGMDTDRILNTIKPEFDVDYLTDKNNEKLKNNTNEILPPTPGAIIEILKELNINVAGKKIAVIGKGALVGAPIAIILKNLGANVTVCDSKTTDLKGECLKADIIITGVGKKDIIRGDMVKDGAIVIDAGTCFVDGKMYGDVNVPETLEKASYVTPTPGGVGPITVAILMLNTAICAGLILK